MTEEQAAYLNRPAAFTLLKEWPYTTINGTMVIVKPGTVLKRTPRSDEYHIAGHDLYLPYNTAASNPEWFKAQN